MRQQRDPESESPTDAAPVDAEIGRAFAGTRVGGPLAPVPAVRFDTIALPLFRIGVLPLPGSASSGRPRRSSVRSGEPAIRNNAYCPLGLDSLGPWPTPAPALTPIESELAESTGSRRCCASART